VEAVPVVAAIVAHLCESGKTIVADAMFLVCLPATALRIINPPVPGRYPEA